MSCYRAGRVCLGAIALWAVVNLPVQAEIAIKTQGLSSSKSAASTATNLLTAAPYIPELPPLRPTLPETSASEVRLVLKLKDRRVYVYQGDRVQKSYPVAIGRSGWETPTGQYQVLSMVKNPGWTNPLTREVIPPGPDSPLGERWIAFWTDGRNYIGFHGTPDRSSIGQAASHGCVRMFNEHIRELYPLIAVGTPVTVTP